MLKHRDTTAVTALTTTTTDGAQYTPVMFIGGKCYPMLLETEQPTRKPLTDEQRARRNLSARTRRALGMTPCHGWSGHWQRR